ncbi:hypothetical protein [Halobacillus sp. Marseille-Q1614]|uniref:hypothetical protein n=1 Tax=Halobacillus sp. Marseille-Q1614 TaxID=2709134 RepID=UPI00156EDC98|nr:hypothetical protein [Halobacillus sp. Marseille-Q1614]
MSHTIKERKQPNNLIAAVIFLISFLGGALLRSKIAPDDPSIRQSTKGYVKDKYNQKTDKLNEKGKQRYQGIQRKKQSLKSEARKDAITQV